MFKYEIYLVSVDTKRHAGKDEFTVITVVVMAALLAAALGAYICMVVDLLAVNTMLHVREAAQTA